jgi:predicted NBD/HSP70 family sugar kinase
MSGASGWVVVGLDNGGTSNNATVLDGSGKFLVDRLVELPSRVKEGPTVAVEALAAALDNVLTLVGVDRSRVHAVGLDTPGPASATGVISSKGSTNFSEPAWRGFDFRGALADRLGLPVIYNNDGNAAALYAHFAHFGVDATERSSISAIVGTGLGGGDRVRPDRPGCRRDGRRAGSRTHPDARDPGRRAGRTGLQLRVRR